jgi:hypothetical protein
MPIQIPADGNLVFAWGRYLYWAELSRRNWHRFITRNPTFTQQLIPQWLGVSCYWAASLYVVIEGWEEAGFQDPLVDRLLKLSDYKAVLKKLRNGTFHYQPSIFSPKITDFFKSIDTTVWLNILQEEFVRWLRDCFETLKAAGPMPAEKAQQWWGELATIMGALPLSMTEPELENRREYRRGELRKLGLNLDDYK